MTSEELKAQVVAKAKSDETFRTAVVNNPKAAISALAGGTLPEGFTFDPSTELELTDEELATVAGGDPDPWAIFGFRP